MDPYENDMIILLGQDHHGSSQYDNADHGKYDEQLEEELDPGSVLQLAQCESANESARCWSDHVHDT